jgi:pimeloyl-ACP methyl ester carboxylesterase
VLGWLFGASQRVQDPSDMLVTVAAEDAFDAAPQLHRMTAPTLLVAGGRDRFYTRELLQEAAERIPGARLALYQDKGHAGVITHKPAIREIITFLRPEGATDNYSVRMPCWVLPGWWASARAMMKAPAMTR